MMNQEERVNSIKILGETGINCCARTIQRYMKQSRYVYRKFINKIV